MISWKLAGLVALAAISAAVVWLWTPDRPRSELERLYARGPQDFLEVAGLRLHVRDTGPRDGRAVLLLHGFGSSLHTWEPWAVALSDKFRVVRMDLPGFGLTGADPTGDYSDGRTVAVILALMDKLGLAKATLIGNSMGGRFAWKLASLHPERVDKLVLISPDGFSSPDLPYGRASPVPLMVKMMRYVLPRAMVKGSLEPAYGNPALMSEATTERYYDLMRAPGVRDAMIARMAQGWLEEPEPLLRRIEAPTLLVWGERDRMIPFKNASDYTRVLRSSRLVSFPDLGHLPFEEAPTQSLVPVRAFLEE